MAHILFVASEMAPLAKTGGLADVVGALPQALTGHGHRVQVIMPYYRRFIAADGVQPTGRSLPLWIDGSQRHCPIHRTATSGIEVLLVEQDDLFDRDGIYGPPGGAYDDNLLRFTLLCRMALEWAAESAEPFDILHCHDWQSALVPLLLNHQYRHRPALARTHTIFTIHNLAYQGVFAADGIARMGLPPADFHLEGYEFHHQINCMKAGILAADAITTVSPSYAGEILTPEYGCQLSGFLARFRGKLSGIVNGIDTAQWNPASDPHIARHFAAGRASGKKQCKAALQQACGLADDRGAPLFATISRLAEQKGIDLLIKAAPTWLERGAQLVVLGSGDGWLEARLHELTARYPAQCAFHQGFNEPLARQIYAGADLFAMPSRFEPCGLGQLMAMRYGAIPVVRATGGLRDTVIDHDSDPARSTGFSFSEASADALAEAGLRAMALYRDHPRRFARMVGRALRRDSSWNASATAYDRIYTKLTA